MNFEACFRLLAERLKDEVIVTSAGNCSELWWEITGETERVFYLEASMSLASLFAAGIALGAPERTIVALSGDGAFCMNPGMLMVERDMNLPNLTHFLVSNRVYGATSNAGLPNVKANDYAAIARAMGLERVLELSSIEALDRELAALSSANAAGHTFVVLEVEPFSAQDQKLEQPPFDGPELKFRFGRHIEARIDCSVFGYRL